MPLDPHPGGDPSRPIESISGLIERVTFFNEENGFSIVKAKVKGHRDLVTVLGSAPSVNAGEWLKASGRWIRDREYGLQFKADHFTNTAPNTREGIEKYLGSGMIKGIGPVHASKLVAHFGETIFDVIEEKSARLEEVDGIGPNRRRKIKDAWIEQKKVREIMVFLHAHGVSTSRAVRIYKTYGDGAVERVTGNPYLLCRDIHGIGFKTADQVARRLGIALDSLIRAAAGLNHILLEATGNGHCGLPVQALLDEAGKLLLIEAPLIATALEQETAKGEVIRESIGGEELIFLPYLQRSEIGIARRIQDMVRADPAYPPIAVDKALAWSETRTGKTLAASQRRALELALKNRLLIITGGPGVGKTTLLNTILGILRAKKVRCELCAPTGRAAKRLGDATGQPARTIHRLLEVNPRKGGFARNEKRPLDADLVVVDECSMIDVPLMFSLLRAVPRTASLLLVGDADQLPSVGPGLVLHHLIQSGIVPTVHLTEIFRQAAGSRIITSAHRIHQGLLPDTESNPADSDFFFIKRDEPDAIASTVLDLAAKRIPDRFQLDPIRDIQVLCPMNRGNLGVRELNLRLQSRLNPEREHDPGVERFGWRFRAGDKVIQTVNNYDKDVFNGDIGQILSVHVEDGELVVGFDQRKVHYEFGELDELSLAYAITIHKSQGSEFPAVIIPAAMQQYLLLQRNLVYTGITRGKQLVVVVGQPKAVAIAVRNNETAHRHSGLLARLKST